MSTINLLSGGNKKEVIKSIIDLAKSLPPVAEEYKQKIKIKGSEVKKMQHSSWTKDQIDKVMGLNDDKFYELINTRLRMVNHKRRMLDAFDKNGKEGIAKYLVWHSNQLKFLKEKYGNQEGTIDKNTQDVEAKD